MGLAASKNNTKNIDEQPKSIWQDKKFTITLGVSVIGAATLAIIIALIYAWKKGKLSFATKKSILRL